MWPQFVYLALFLVGFGVLVSRLGEPKTDTYDWADLFASLFVLWILYMGGFFDKLLELLK